MPVYEFRCRKCDEEFEALVSPGDSAPCPSCGHTETERLFSAISGPLKFGLRGGEARRSNAVRRAREEQRRERRAKRNEPPR